MRLLPVHCADSIPWWIGAGLLIGVLVVPNFLAAKLAKVWLQFPGLDKPAHFLAFIGVFLIIYGVLRGYAWPRSEGHKQGLAAVLSLGLSLGDEAQQAMLGIGRTAESGDLVADTAGILVGVVAVRSRQLGMKWAMPLILLLLVPVAGVTAKTHQDLKHYNLGMLYEREKDYQKAREEYQLALDSGFESAQLYNAIAWLDIEFLGADPKLVEPYAARAYALDPDNPDILDTYGWVLVQAGKIYDGLLLLEKAKRLKPDIYCIDLHLGATHLALGMRHQAIQFLREQVNRTGSDRFGEAAARLLAQIEQSSSLRHNNRLIG
ncbi:MAG: VanZ family protein [Nitrospira sp.]|nr:VanZ family protein [Nitrospira sp.]